jgi:hypothetical protein
MDFPFAVIGAIRVEHPHGSRSGLALSAALAEHPGT